MWLALEKHKSWRDSGVQGLRFQTLRSFQDWGKLPNLGVRIPSALFSNLEYKDLDKHVQRTALTRKSVNP